MYLPSREYLPSSAYPQLNINANHVTPLTPSRPCHRRALGAGIWGQVPNQGTGAEPGRVPNQPAKPEPWVLNLLELGAEPGC